MTSPPVLHAIVLLLSAALAAWSGIAARQRRTMPGTTAFGLAMAAIAFWAAIGALHAIVPSTTIRIRLSQLQYAGIVAVAPLWLLFGTQYVRQHWFRDKFAWSMLWVMPVMTLLMALSNDWHRLLWTRVEPLSNEPGARLVYHHGAWFWVALAFNYACIAASTLLLLVSLRRFPRTYRYQTGLLLIGALLPWVGNILYVGGFLPPGLDLTPLAFAASGAILLWGFYRHRYFGLVPIARDLVVDSMDEAVIVLDTQRQIVDFNPAAERVAGCSREIIGRSIDEVVPWWTRAVDDAEEPASPAVIATGSGFLEVDVKPVRDEATRFAGWLVVARDVSLRRQAEHERRELERRVQDQQRRDSLSVLAAGVAHDFNNLLTGILGNADLVSMHAGADPALRKSADAIVIGAQRAADLVAKILAYAGEGRVIAEMIDFDALVREMHDLLQASVAQHCHLEYHSNGPMPLVRADPTQVRQVLLNLIANASEAVDDGGRVVVDAGTDYLDAVALRRATYSADAVPGVFAYVQVSDNGPGMDRATQARVFEPFFSTRQDGRGLGLAAVQGIVRSHRGALTLTSQPGEGTTFKVWFPIDHIGKAFKEMKGAEGSEGVGGRRR